jgi:hypothetical protein
MNVFQPRFTRLAALGMAAITLALAQAPAMAHGPYGGRGGVGMRPHYGHIVWDVPRFAAFVTIAGIAYLVANDVYYRPRDDGSYVVVAPPVQAEPQPAAPLQRVFIYPRQNQSADKQASDEYECHRWAVSQVGFDPSGASVGQTGTGDPARRGDYLRAQAACLDGRGYTVR